MRNSKIKWEETEDEDETPLFARLSKKVKTEDSEDDFKPSKVIFCRFISANYSKVNDFCDRVNRLIDSYDANSLFTKITLIVFFVMQKRGKKRQSKTDSDIEDDFKPVSVQINS